MTKEQLIETAVKYVYREISEDVFLTAVDAYSSASNGAKPLVSGSLPHEPMQNRIAKAADKFLADNSTTPHIDHWSFRMGARWMQNEMLGGNDR